MPLRTLQPAPSRRKPAARVESSSESPQTPASYRPAAVQACLDCRRLKIKCDGTWPKCSTCTAKNRTCGYVGQEGQSRATAVRSRLEYLEEVVAALKTSNPDQLDAIVQGIRTAEDPAGVSGLSSNGPTTPDQQHRQSNMLLLANKLVSDFRLLLPEPPLVQQAVNSFFSCSGKLFHVFSEDYIAQCYRAVFDEPQASSENLKSKVCTLAAVAAVGAQYTPDAIDKESELGLYNLSRHFIEVAMEHEPLHAIKICALFAQYNIMSKEMIALTYVETGLSMCHIYGINNRALRPDHIPSMEWSDLRKTWRTLIFFSSWLSSTLGYISGNAWSAEKRVLMDLKVEDPMDITEAVQTEMARICLLKAEILRMHMVFKDLTSPAVEAIRKDLQGWYDELPELLRLEATAHESLPVGIKRSILHLHMLYLGAIMLLYRRVATMFLQSYANGGPSYSLHLHPLQAFAQQSTEAILAATTSARIVKLLLEDEGVFKHCWLVIFQTYTTCTILLHSVVQKQLHNFPPSAWEDDLEKARDCLSVLAFCGSQDRVASQFHGQLKRVFQAVIAYGSSSVPENGFEEMEVEQETTQSHSTFSAMDEGAGQPQPADHAYLLDIPVDADPSHIHLSCYLLMMLSQPFGDLSMKEATEVNMRQHWLADPLRYEYPQMAARLVDWNLEDKHMFQWDLGKLNIPHLSLMETSKEPSTSEDSTDSGLSSNRSWGTFLGSTEPSGWGSAASLTSSVSAPKLQFELAAVAVTIGRRRRDRDKQGFRLPSWLRRRMGQEESTLVDESVPPETLTERSLSAVADYIKNGPKKRIVVLTGAGISTAAGIPDFRTPKTGLYNNLARLNLPYAEAVFDISYFRQHPEPFYVLAQELYPGKFHPTVSHAFIALLAQKGLLQMLFTQNIDCLERRAGVPAEKIIEAHGSFATQRCVECKVEFPDHLMEHHVLKGQVPRCEEQGCTGTVKPDIVFFGEALPSAFGENSYQTAMADVVLILGTSLTVYPFAGLPEMARQGKPRVLFNMERVGQLGRRADDVMELGSCDEGIRKLADELGWREELEAYWRGVVGHEEAEKQLRSAREREDEVEDEVQKLTAGVESALRFDDEPGPSGVERDETQAAERDEKAHAVGEKTPEVAKKDNSPVVDSEEKHEAAASGDLPEKVDESTADTESKQTSTKLPGDSSIKTESAASQAIDEEKEESKKPSL